MSPLSLEVRVSAQHGRGVFATRPIAERVAIIEFTGPRLTLSDLDAQDYHLQIGEDEYLGPSGLADDYINHSCEPNAAFAGSLWLVTTRAIAPGEEITWDYSTAIDEADFGGFACHCGAVGCRGEVRSFRDLAPTVRARLAPHVLPYLRAQYFAKI